MNMRTTPRLLPALAAALLAASLPAHAQELPALSIHGFGGWGYGRTGGNSYLLGEKGGDYQHNNFALSLAATPYERVSVFTQIEFTNDYISRGEEEGEVELDYAFAEYTFSDALRLRAGQVKQPFGIYTEIFDVGTVRPLFTLPQGIYGPSEVVAESFKGVGLAGTFAMAGGWGMDYDVYGGALDELKSGGTLPHAVAILGGEEEEEEDEPGVKDMVGGRLVVRTPLEGLSVGASAYTGTTAGHEEEDEVAEDAKGRVTVIAGQSSLQRGRLSLRGEVARHTHQDAESLDAAYAEAGLMLTRSWQAVARYDWARVESIEGVELDDDSELLRHRDATVGLNYWVNPRLVFRASYHNVRGNLFAAPDGEEALHDAILGGTLDRKTDLLLLGVQFSF